MKKISLFLSLLIALCSIRANATDIDDICKTYGTSYIIGLEDDDFYPYMVEISRNYLTNEENSVLLDGLYYTDQPITAVFDSGSNSLVINKQNLFYDQKNRIWIELILVRVNSEEDVEMINSISASIDEEGKIIFPDNVGFFIGNTGMGYLWGGYRLALTPEFEFNEPDWKPIGTGLFQDAWIVPYFGENAYYSLQAHEVQIMASTKVKGDFLMVNPYKNEEIEEMLASQLGGSVAQEGYIRFNMSDEGFVYVYPLVNSGVSINMDYLEHQGSYMQDLYNFNIEGFLTFCDDPKEEIIDYLESEFMPVSRYNNKTQTASFYNCRFGLSSNPLYGYSWNINNWENPNSLLYSTLVFDAYAGVNSIGEESAEEPVRYFNLQGKEVKNPDKGSLLIRVSGNKATKVIIP